MASFRTAYLQREEYVDVAVKGANTYTANSVSSAADLAYAARFSATNPDASVVIVEDLVKLTPATAAGVPAYIERVQSLADATHIVAQSDETVGYGHIPVENRDYRYIPVVLNTFTGTATTTTPKKHVMLYEITAPEDIVLNEAYGETA